MFSTPDSSAPEGGLTLTETAPQPRVEPQGGLWDLGTLLVRAMILGASLSLGWLGGVLLAQVLPDRNPAPPLPEVMLRQASQTGRKLRQLPQWWQGTESIAAAGAEPAAALASRDSPSVTATSAQPELSATERQRLEDGLPRLQEDLGQLEDRLAELEDAVGQPSGGSLHSRLQQLEQLRLQSHTPASTAASDPASPVAPPPTAAKTSSEPRPGVANPALATPYPEPQFPLVTDRIVLPSALLFEPESSTLTESGQQLLNTIVPDLRRSGAATLVVGSHTDGADSAELAQQLTFQQALAVQQYLDAQLGAEPLRWVTVGYGESRPRSEENTPAAQSRNQRVDIGLVR
ncbi:MAG: OmpA family protein [Nodosilinea sp.]